MVTSKWWLGLFGLWILIVILCETTEGATSMGGTSDLNVLLSSGASITGATALWGVITKAFTWNYSFFQSGIGVWLKLPLMALSIAVIIPFLYDTARLIIPWKQ